MPGSAPCAHSLQNALRLGWSAAAVSLAFGGAAIAQTADEVRARVDASRSAVQLFIGSSVADGKLRDLMVEPWSGSWGDDTVLGAAYSYRLLRFWRYFAVDAELGGMYRFGDTQGGEFWAAGYLRFDGFPWNHRLFTTVGISMGPDFVTRLPRVERGTTQHPEPNQSRFLNFFSPEVSLALPDRPHQEVVFRYLHRSGIFGLYNGVYEGANSFTVGFRMRF